MGEAVLAACAAARRPTAVASGQDDGGAAAGAGGATAPPVPPRPARPWGPPTPDAVGGGGATDGVDDADGGWAGGGEARACALARAGTATAAVADVPAVGGWAVRAFAGALSQKSADAQLTRGTKPWLREIPYS